MKSKELIKQLQELDPEGETEVGCGNYDILSAHMEPAYWDGRFHLLIRDPKKAPYYDVIGAKYMSKGNKIVLTAYSVTDVLWENPEAVIDYSEASAHHQGTDDITRQQSRNVELKVAMDAFHRWVVKKAEAIRPDEKCRAEADSFYETHLSPEDPVKDLPTTKDKDGYEWHASWNDRQEAMWDDTLEVSWVGEWSIKKKEQQMT